jgi:hypothetical protein
VPLSNEKNMKYVALKNSKTGKIRKLGRFSGEPDYTDEYYSPISDSWEETIFCIANF